MVTTIVIVGVIGLLSTVLLTGCWLLDRRAGRRQLKDVLGDEHRSARLAALPAETVAAVLGEPLPRPGPRARDRPERDP
jgi:hypothetical protein